VQFIAGLDIVQDFHDEKGDEQNPKDGDLVRGCHRTRIFPRLAGLSMNKPLNGKPEIRIAKSERSPKFEI
jgi:hypothetical protein